MLNLRVLHAYFRVSKLSYRDKLIAYNVSAFP
jgi:hypothetical protein